jgi:peptidoglycan/xylan/chitin deacetylase (PgdA/CDA1 family)
MATYWYLMNIAEYLLSDYKVIFKSNCDKVILTIDDVPYDSNGEELEKILNVLKKYNNNATFFVISSQINEVNKHLLIRAIKEGHHLANHGKHNTMHAMCDLESLKKEIEHCDHALNILYAEANVELPKTKYFRPGVGYVTNLINDYCSVNNYKIVLGTIYPSDARIKWKWLNKKYIVNHLSKLSDDIIILHDRKWTAEMLDSLFEDTGLRTYTCNILNS